MAEPVLGMHLEHVCLVSVGSAEGFVTRVAFDDTWRGLRFVHSLMTGQIVSQSERSAANRASVFWGLI